MYDGTTEAERINHSLRATGNIELEKALNHLMSWLSVSGDKRYHGAFVPSK